ncbi:pyruvate dehydrogenase E2 component (dihydrolipoamide acetyltransferase) [Lysinibacillus composti]|uniref:Dihydrolipoamide acetyltransferase component of pyruvate dehydrogenase complex n=1 Tax=Lysinibacillus composti TaxID=720633 RepID=A0A3N9UJA8_9BACI|nr:dihydrolipoamide acetyltransferase family protein [Lysinibacillus composti]MBM7607403.1 pyruvate dehydrogenase E2 component (dihydrolipoamide acetyltransferase) [Lysinibacillus composti]RQW76041.1 2-oxo acid dehydrogenase subunit E2 [Lysinibacillus composti]
MATEVLMPKLGATMESGTIVEWFKKEGDHVEEGEPLVEILTDKIEIEVEASASGILLKALYEKDTKIPVNEVIAYIGAEGEQISENSTYETANANAVQDVEVQSQPASVSSIVPTTSEQISEIGQKPRRTPAARVLAEEKGVDLQSVSGSGPLGRIHRIDVEKFLEQNERVVKATPLAQKIAAEHKVDLSVVKGSGSNGKIRSTDVIQSTQVTQEIGIHKIESTNTIPLQGVRKIVAQRMANSAFTAPHVTITSEIDMNQVIELRKQLLPIIEQEVDYRLSYTEIIVKAVAQALLKNPVVNASIQDDQIVLHQHAHIGLAVALENGLVVPVIRHVEQKGLAELTKTCKTLGVKAREGKLAHNEITGGTFTISNLGMYAVDAFTPIINQPESAILGVGRIIEKPVVNGGEIEVRSMMVLSLSFDHRVIDGAPAAQFLTDLKTILENPFRLLV